MKTQRTFKPGDYCRFTPEEIPSIIALLKANGWPVWKSQDFKFSINDECISFDSQGEFLSKLIPKDGNEMTRHDFFVTALRLSTVIDLKMTREESSHIKSVIKSLGLNDAGFFLGNYSYPVWCKRLNETPINIQSEIYENLCRIDSEPIHIPDVGEKVDMITSIIESLAGFKPSPTDRYSVEQIVEICELYASHMKNTLPLPDGTTVDLTKPLEVSYGGDKWEDDELEFHFVGFNSSGHIIVECLSDCELQAVDKIRNKPEEVKEVEIPDICIPVLAKIEHINELGKPKWFEVVYYESGWRPYSGSKTFQDGERVVSWKYAKDCLPTI